MDVWFRFRLSGKSSCNTRGKIFHIFHPKSQLEAQELESKQKLLSREMADVTAKKDKLSEARRQLEEPLAGADLLSFFLENISGLQRVGQVWNHADL